jgi:1,4-dihydroxy-2-naphthoate octaprenyltransferase
LDWSVLWIALPVGLITDGILHSNNTRDMVPDKRADIKTMAMGLGTKVSAWLYGFEVIFPFIWIAVCSIIGIMPFYTVFIFLTIPVALGCARTMIKAAKTGSDIIADLDVRTANLQLMFSLILALTFIVSKFIA